MQTYDKETRLPTIRQIILQKGQKQAIRARETGRGIGNAGKGGKHRNRHLRKGTRPETGAERRKCPQREEQTGGSEPKPKLGKRARYGREGRIIYKDIRRSRQEKRRRREPRGGSRRKAKRGTATVPRRIRPPFRRSRRPAAGSRQWAGAADSSARTGGRRCTATPCRATG